jgi:Amt family ammonium transporter
MATNEDIHWVLTAGFLVFFMHCGFCMLEAGSVRHKNAVNIMFKNFGTVAIAGICYYILGYAFAYGTDNAGNKSSRFIGSGYYALSGFQETSDPEEVEHHLWFFQYAFAATAATIVSGAVAGRVNLTGYFITVVLLTSFVYPVVSHWIWASQGWASAFNGQPWQGKGDTGLVFGNTNGSCGMIDFAGSGVVHLTGGMSAFWGAKIVGPRLGRFDANGNVVGMPPHNIGMQTLGVFILWFGWYGFNVGSTLGLNGFTASKVATTTTLSPSMAVVTAMVYSRLVYKHYDIGLSLNSALAGLVSITASCSVVDDWAAIIIGFIGFFVYQGASVLMKKMQVDDPVDAVAVHGACGIWGCLAAGIFATPNLIYLGYSDRICDGWTSGLQFGTQIVGVLAIIGWVTLWMVPLFLILKFANVLRVPAEFEENGLDISEHGGQAAFIGDTVVVETKPVEESAAVDNDPPASVTEEVQQA